MNSEVDGRIRICRRLTKSESRRCVAVSLPATFHALASPGSKSSVIRCREPPNRTNPMKWLSVSFLAAVLSTSSALPQDRDAGCREIVLHNGRVTTMDARGTTASAIVIRDDRITMVSSATGIPAHSPCAKVIDLKGRRVIPGLIDTHVHISYFAGRPGYAVHLVSASSVATVQPAIRA